MGTTARRPVHLGIASSGTTEVTLNTAIAVVGVVGSQRADEEEEHENSSTKHNKTALGRLGVAILSPGTASTSSVLAHFIAAELVPDKTSQRDGVTEELESSDRGLPDEHRGGNQEDILEHTAQGHHERGSLANLHGRG